MGDISQQQILDLLLTKSALKQDIFSDTKQVFDNLKRVLSQEVLSLRTQITDERIRMQYMDKGEFEAQVYVGSDVLLFHRHSNVFLLPDSNPKWETEYLKEDARRGYFGIIYIYNFLAQSFLQNRLDDPGYLIGRIFVNCEGHFFIEGKGPLGTQFEELGKAKITDKVLKELLLTAFAFAVDFDLLTPPYEIVSQVNVRQIQAISANLSLQTGKRLGFKFEKEDQEIF